MAPLLNFEDDDDQFRLISRRPWGNAHKQKAIGAQEGGNAQVKQAMGHSLYIRTTPILIPYASICATIY